jgi:hypothetical protein
MTVVLSSAGMYAAMKAARGAVSICAVQCRRTSHIRADRKSLGHGIRERKMLEGVCVNAMVLMFPMRRASDAANRLEQPATRAVVKKV